MVKYERKEETKKKHKHNIFIRHTQHQSCDVSFEITPLFIIATFFFVIPSFLHFFLAYQKFFRSLIVNAFFLYAA